MAYITLEDAKSHLRVTDDNSNADIQRKLTQAEAIIVDYLKSRAHLTATITSSSVANPTVITTDAAHGFSNGDTVTIADHEDSTPDLNGEHVVSNVTTLTFTVPVTVTVAGTGGIALVEWSEDTVPGQVVSATLLMLSHLYEHRDDQKSDEEVWSAIRRLLERSRDPAFA